MKIAFWDFPSMPGVPGILPWAEAQPGVPGNPQNTIFALVWAVFVLFCSCTAVWTLVTQLVGLQLVLERPGSRAARSGSFPPVPH